MSYFLFIRPCYLLFPCLDYHFEVFPFLFVEGLALIWFLFSIFQWRWHLRLFWTVIKLKFVVSPLVEWTRINVNCYGWNRLRYCGYFLMRMMTCLVWDVSASPVTGLSTDPVRLKRLDKFRWLFTSPRAKCTRPITGKAVCRVHFWKLLFR